MVRTPAQSQLPRPPLGRGKETLRASRTQESSTCRCDEFSVPSIAEAGHLQPVCRRRLLASSDLRSPFIIISLLLSARSAFSGPSGSPSPPFFRQTPGQFQNGLGQCQCRDGRTLDGTSEPRLETPSAVKNMLRRRSNSSFPLPSPASPSLITHHIPPSAPRASFFHLFQSPIPSPPCTTPVSPRRLLPSPFPAPAPLPC
ncbi:hypothetical protein B0J18DRAFT_154828 [Chaetomium sp. MPI-SDFR-AT-0129]|nr:hypothetical protein B0J18DRAFT_154828 [Chaetomium sp. MPI-SDFR-AT-0129]